MNPNRFANWVVLLFLTIQVATAQSETRIKGTWKGEVTIPGQEVSLVFDIDRQLDGKHSGTLLVPKLFPHKIPLSLVMIKGKNVTFDVDAIKAGFTGRMSGTGNRIKGSWAQGGYELPLTLELAEDREDISEIARPQLSLGRINYITEEVTFLNSNDGYTLSGTLTRPKDSFRPAPGIVLVSDAGPHDRDGTILRHKPFLVLADYLTNKGFAVLRFDDRGIGKSPGEMTTATMTDLLKDAESAFDYLKIRKEIDTGKIGIIGHGQGASIAAQIASQRGDPAFIVMMAGPGLTGAESILLQNQAIGKAANAPPQFVELTHVFLSSLFEILASQTPDLAKLDRLGKKFEADAKKMGSDDAPSIAELGLMIKNVAESIPSPWMQSYLKEDPGPALEKIQCPVLAITGDQDLEIVSKKHLPEIEKHLKAGGNRSFQVRELKGLNHLFQECDTGLSLKYGEIEQTISPRVLRGIGEWIVGAVK